MFTDRIDTALIQQKLGNDQTCELVESIESTQSAVKPNSLLIAEHQSSGVGRRGKQWLTPKGRAICFSYRFVLPLKPSQLCGYQITSALAITTSILHFESSAQIQLKWPNDLYHNEKKFAGILINLNPKPLGTEVILGIGINWHLSPTQIKSVDQAVCNIPFENVTTRSEFIAQLIKQIQLNNQRYVELGLTGFIDQWEKHDFLKNKHINLAGVNHELNGSYQGINSQGELLLRTDQGIKSFSSGEVSVKAV